MMKTEIQQFPLATVIKKPFDAELVRNSLQLGVPVLAETPDEERALIIDVQWRDNGISIYYCCQQAPFDVAEVCESDEPDLITILPPLPRHPKPEHVPLLCRYMADGINPFAIAKYKGEDTEMWGVSLLFLILGHTTWCPEEIILDGTALDTQGNRHEIAIEG